MSSLLKEFHTFLEGFADNEKIADFLKLLEVAILTKPLRTVGIYHGRLFRRALDIKGKEYISRSSAYDRTFDRNF